MSSLCFTGNPGLCFLCSLHVLISHSSSLHHLQPFPSASHLHLVKDTAAIHWYSSGWYSCRIKLSSPMQSPDAAQKQMSASRWLVVAIWVGTGRVHLHTVCIFETSTQPLFDNTKHCPTTHLSQQYPWKVMPSLRLPEPYVFRPWGQYGGSVTRRWSRWSKKMQQFQDA